MSLNYSEIEKYISRARLQHYENICSGEPRKTLKLYQTNLRLSQAFYPILSLFEVILRNAIDYELTLLFSDNNWLINQQSRFMSHRSFTYTDRRTGTIRHNHFLKNSVAKSITELGAAATHGKIIADLKFGYWTALFDITPYRILSGRPIQIFSNLPAGANRILVHQKLNRIRDFRNRIYHNEPIIFGKDPSGNATFDLSVANQIYSDIKECFIWLNLDFAKWAKRINNIDFELERANRVMKHYPHFSYYFCRFSLGCRHYRRKYARINN